MTDAPAAAAAAAERRVARALLVREGALWIAGVAYLAAHAAAEPAGRTLCLLRNLGVEACPGCGLGRSIALLFAGRAADAFAAHPLGPAALLILVARIAHLIYRSSPRFQSKGRIA